MAKNNFVNTGPLAPKAKGTPTGAAMRMVMPGAVTDTKPVAAQVIVKRKGPSSVPALPTTKY